MRRFQAGLECGDLTQFSSSTVSGTGMSVGASGATPLTGGYDLYCAYDGAGTKGSAYVTYKGGFTPGGFWLNVQGDSAQNSRSLIDTANGVFDCDLRWNYKTNLSPSATNVITICNIQSNTIAIRMVKLVPTLIAAGTASLPALTAGTAYRFHVHIRINAAGKGYATLVIYDYGTNTEHGRGSVAVTITGSPMIDTILFGCMPLATSFMTGAQYHRFDDFAANDGQVVASGLHAGDCGAGAVLAFHRPNADGTNVQWLRGGTDSGTDFGQVNEAVDADYLYTETGATLHVEELGLPNYGGANVVKSVGILAKHKRGPTGSDDTYHNGGIYDGTNYIDCPFYGVGGTAWAWQGFICQEQYGTGGAWTNALYNAAQVCLRKTANVSNTNTKAVTFVGVEAEDNAGLAETPNPGTRPLRTS